MKALLRSPPRARLVAPAPRALPPVEYLLAQGGDGRLQIDAATGLNIYGCRPTPRPEALHFSSSTASSISERAWRRAGLVRDRLARTGDYATQVEENRAELIHLLRLRGTGVEIVFAPSGTDATLYALAAARAALGTPLTSVIVAADETGSGARFAASGRHFAGVTAQGRVVAAGEPIAGLADGVHLGCVNLRDTDGRLLPTEMLDHLVLTQVEQAVAAGHRVLLHAMDHSKLGNRCPSDACLAEIEASFDGRVRIVVDACQGRLARERVRAHLARDRMVLVTGSKFFTGPPLSGALLLPHALARRVAAIDAVPPGLGDYAGAGDWPSARASRYRPENIGQLLRWSAALAEMSHWFAAPEAERQASLAAFAAAVPRVAAQTETIELLELPSHADREFPAPTIFPFFVRRGASFLSPAQAGVLHRALNRDVTSLLPGLAARDRAKAALLCHVGQPVCVAGREGPTGALRLSASARIVDPSGCGVTDALGLVFAKIELLVRNYDRIEQVL